MRFHGASEWVPALSSGLSLKGKLEGAESWFRVNERYRKQEGD